MSVSKHKSCSNVPHNLHNTLLEACMQSLFFYTNSLHLLRRITLSKYQLKADKFLTLSNYCYISTVGLNNFIKTIHDKIERSFAGHASKTCKYNNRKISQVRSCRP